MTEEQIKKTILIVDDDPPIVRAIVDKLTMQGFKMIQATDGEEGLTVALREHPDLILLDILMPKMDGLTMMKKLRETNEWAKKVPIILLTNLNPGSEQINKSITEDAPAYFLLKADWELEDVVEKVKECLHIT